jgi:hypothetical protein
MKRFTTLAAAAAISAIGATTGFAETSKEDLIAVINVRVVTFEQEKTAIQGLLDAAVAAGNNAEIIRLQAQRQFVDTRIQQAQTTISIVNVFPVPAAVLDQLVSFYEEEVSPST